MTRAEKLAAAIAYLRSINRYCLEVPLGVNFYRPVHGWPLGYRK